MPLIADRTKRKKTAIHEEILSPIHEQMLKYCKWAGITDIGYFIEESAKHIFINDKLWQEFLKTEQSDAEDI